MMRSRMQNSDDQTRQANLTLMQQKRRKHLEEQLENKMQLLSQYTNTRGIGMRGATVPQRDIDLLNNQIAEIRASLAEFTGNPSSAQQQQQARQMQAQQQQQTRHQVQQPPVQQQQPHFQQQQQQVGGFNRAPAPGQAPQQNVAGAKSKRDQVWERKFSQWKERNMSMPRGGAQVSNNGRFQAGGQIISGAGVPVLDQENQPLQWLPSNGGGGGGGGDDDQMVQKQHHQQQQQVAPFQQQQQQQSFGDSVNGPRYGRRAPSAGSNTDQRSSVSATPTGSQYSQQPPMMQQQQQQHQPQQQVSLPVAPAAATNSTRRNMSNQHKSTALW